MKQLPWEQLVLRTGTDAEHRLWLKPWRWLIRKPVTPLFLNRFGCWFFEQPDGTIALLDVFFGQVEQIADSRAAFESCTQNPAWQETYLLHDFVVRLIFEGKGASGSSCYAIAPHPIAGGPDPWEGDELDTASVMVMECLPWQSTCSQMVRAAREVLGEGRRAGPAL